MRQVIGLARLRVAPLLAPRRRTTATRNALGADERHAAVVRRARRRRRPTPAACRTPSTQVAEHGWVHHIPRLMVLGTYALQRGWAPPQVTDWFHRGVRRRLRLGDGAQRRRHVAARRRRGDGDQAVHLGRRLHQHDDRPLRLLPLRPEGAGRARTPARSPPATGGSSTGTASGFAGNHRMAQALGGLDRLARPRRAGRAGGAPAGPRRRDRARSSGLQRVGLVPGHPLRSRHLSVRSIGDGHARPSPVREDPA